MDGARGVMRRGANDERGVVKRGTNGER